MNTDDFLKYLFDNRIDISEMMQLSEIYNAGGYPGVLGALGTPIISRQDDFSNTFYDVYMHDREEIGHYETELETEMNGTPKNWNKFETELLMPWDDPSAPNIFYNRLKQDEGDWALIALNLTKYELSDLDSSKMNLNLDIIPKFLDGSTNYTNQNFNGNLMNFNAMTKYKVGNTDININNGITLVNCINATLSHYIGTGMNNPLNLNRIINNKYIVPIIVIHRINTFIKFSMMIYDFNEDKNLYEITNYQIPSNFSDRNKEYKVYYSVNFKENYDTSLLDNRYHMQSLDLFDGERSDSQVIYDFYKHINKN